MLILLGISYRRVSTGEGFVISHVRIVTQSETRCSWVSLDVTVGKEGRAGVAHVVLERIADEIRHASAPHRAVQECGKVVRDKAVGIDRGWSEKKSGCETEDEKSQGNVREVGRRVGIFFGAGVVVRRIANENLPFERVAVSRTSDDRTREFSLRVRDRLRQKAEEHGEQQRCDYIWGHECRTKGKRPRPSRCIVEGLPPLLRRRRRRRTDLSLGRVCIPNKLERHIYALASCLGESRIWRIYFRHLVCWLGFQKFWFL